MTSPVDAESERLRKLQAVVDVALAHLTLDDLFAELLPRVRDLVDADTCAVLLLDEARGELVARAASGLEEEVEQGVRIPLGKGFAGKIAAERRPVIIDDVDHSYVLNPILREKGIHSLVGAPLLVQDRVRGVIHLGSLTPREFTPDEVSLLELVAARVALAVERGRAHEELVRLSELKGTFIGVASHELRTPVAVIYGIVETLEHRSAELSDETRADLMAALSANSRRLKHLVEQLLDLSRLDTRSIRIDARPVRVRELVESLLRHAHPGSSDGVELGIDPELEFVVDPDALGHVVLNLVTNALRYGAPPVTVSAVDRDGHYHVGVADHGPGVLPAFVPHLFERFTRAEEVRDQSGSAGLGLSIALAYAEALGGTLSYRPGKPQGACFELLVPRPPRAEAEHTFPSDRPG